jgi:hypothetical protein
VLRVCGKGTKVVLIPLPPAVGRAIDQSIGARTSEPILLNRRGARLDRYAATRILRFGVALWRHWSCGPAPKRRLLLVPVLGRPEAAADPVLCGEALIYAAYLTAFTDMPTGLRLAEKAGEVAGGLGDDRLLALSRGVLRWVLHFAGQSQPARPLGAESVQRAR